MNKFMTAALLSVGIPLACAPAHAQVSCNTTNNGIFGSSTYCNNGWSSNTTTFGNSATTTINPPMPGFVAPVQPVRPYGAPLQCTTTNNGIFGSTTNCY
jgi:hypothetical protein